MPAGGTGLSNSAQDVSLIVTAAQGWPPRRSSTSYNLPLPPPPPQGGFWPARSSVPARSAVHAPPKPRIGTAHTTRVGNRAQTKQNGRGRVGLPR